MEVDWFQRLERGKWFGRYAREELLFGGGKRGINFSLNEGRYKRYDRKTNTVEETVFQWKRRHPRTYLLLYIVSYHRSFEPTSTAYELNVLNGICWIYAQGLLFPSSTSLSPLFGFSVLLLLMNIFGLCLTKALFFQSFFIGYSTRV